MAEITQIKDDKIVVREYLQAYAGGRYDPAYMYITLTEEKALKMIKELTKYLEGVSNESNITKKELD